jgi:hypothetical protein
LAISLSTHYPPEPPPLHPQEHAALRETVRAWVKRPAGGGEAVAPLTSWLRRWLACRLDTVLVQRTQLLAGQLTLALAAFLETAGQVRLGRGRVSPYTVT